MKIYDEIDKLNKNDFCNDVVSFQKVNSDEDIWYLTEECQLTEQQKDFVNSPGFTFGRAFLNPSDYYICIIRNNSLKPVGFMAFSKWRGHGEAVTWSYCIDSSYQGLGYGISSAKLAVSILKKAFNSVPIKLAVIVDNYKAQEVYKSIGFVFENEYDYDDMVFILR